jgi:Domain of unknown function (DUF4340)
MARTFNNKILLFVLIALVAVFVGVKIFGKRSGTGTFPAKVVRFDTTNIDRVLMNPKVEKGRGIEFVKKGENWRIRQEDKEIPAAKGMVQTLINQIYGFKPVRMATRNPDSWKEYDVTDSAGSRVRLYRGKEKIADFLVGRISYKQAPQTQQRIGMQQRTPNIQGSSFVRNTDEDEVYTVDGFLSITFNRDFNSYRDQTFLRLEKDSVNRIEFIYPLDTGFVLEKFDSIWARGRIPVDGEAVNLFLSGISSRNLSVFNDDFRGDQSPTFRLILSQNGKDPVTVQAFKLDVSTWILNSSMNPEAMFEENGESFIEQLFKSHRFF